ncbi:MAG TPA: hypothetical protein DIU15_10680 [Deltaproteobacteria bacterium]|nr:hypothetical protein [Deltaproteobacteria bacterium]HCP46501.1 hypothetical protein [Deltaproteobacteria bacterium]
MGFDSLQAGSGAAAISVTSWAFLVFAAVAILVGRLVKGAELRRGAMLLLNLGFLSALIRSPGAWLVLTVFLAVVYGLGRIKTKESVRWGAPVQLAVITGLWVFLFLVRDPALLPSVNPFASQAIQLIGISYLVFRGISYVMEVDLLPEEKRDALGFLDFMLYFPGLIAGPIARYRSFREASDGEPTGGEHAVLPALHRIVDGLLLKLVVADNLAPLAIFATSEPATLALPLLWASVLLQLFVIFCDFAGYCHVVLGTAQLIGAPLPENFNRPFSATNLQRFWERWHISLTSMIRDYVFNPAAKLIVQRAERAWQGRLLVAVYFGTMMLVALWHGTTWGMVLFGVLHGLALVAVQLKPKWNKVAPQIPWLQTAGAKRATHGSAVVATYVFVSLTVVLWMGPAERWVEIFALLIGIGA